MDEQILIDYTKQTVDLAYCNFDTIFPKFPAPAVQVLYLSGNPIIDFSFLRFFPNLRRLYCDNCKLRDLYDLDVQYLKQLTHISLCLNDFREFHIFSRSIEVLDISQNICKDISGELPNLKLLRFGFVDLSGGGTVLNSFSVFKSFYLQKNQLVEYQIHKNGFVFSFEEFDFKVKAIGAKYIYQCSEVVNIDCFVVTEHLQIERTSRIICEQNLIQEISDENFAQMYFNDQKQLNMLDTEALKPIIAQLSKQKLYRVISINKGDQTGVIVINEDEEYFQLDQIEQITAKELKRDKGIKIEIVKHQKTNQNMVKTQSIKNSQFKNTEIMPNSNLNTANQYSISNTTNSLKLTNTITNNSIQTAQLNMTQMKTTELNEQIEVTPKIPLVNSVLQVRVKNLNFAHIYCTQETNEEIVFKLSQTINLLFEHELSFISVENLIQKAISAFTGTITDYILLDVQYNNAVIPLLLPLLKIGICDNSGFAITPQCYQKYLFLNIFAKKAVTSRGLTNKVKFGFNLRFDIQKLNQNIKITIEGSGIVYDQEKLKHCNVKIEVRRNGVLISDKLQTEFKGEGLYNVKLSVEQEGEEEFSKFIR
ncbi:Leucine_rich repeat 4 [Hexamita inflata]|uniref:Leucine rich repeat 4 n=1 Tax=Hexamita inflata TaxID=28002 RepID=A0AA86PPI4_9EUKA|nr:Leucine rich repeat 4 [Hexamita inflata]